jgi:ribosomal protein S18 acetylase RimI-like enzyme
MVRVIGDSGLYFYIQDVIVLPQYQKRGIGMLLMKKVMNFLDNRNHFMKNLALLSDLLRGEGMECLKYGSKN